MGVLSLLKFARQAMCCLTKRPAKLFRQSDPDSIVGEISAVSRPFIVESAWTVIKFCAILRLLRLPTYQKRNVWQRAAVTLEFLSARPEYISEGF